MSKAILGGDVPANIPGANLTHEDMARASEDDWADIQRFARGYCRTVDATRSRKRMDGSATVAHSGFAPYGTDDVSDGVTQDAVLIFAQRLGEIIRTCPASAVSIYTRETESWQYTRRDGQTLIVTRETLQRWAVRDAAARNGYRVDVRPDEIESTPGEQMMKALPHAEHVARAAGLSSHISQESEAIWRRVWGDGSEYPVLKDCVFLAGEADHLGRAGILSTVAQARHGGVYGSRWKVRQTRDTAVREWKALSASLDEARAELTNRENGVRDKR